MLKSIEFENFKALKHARLELGAFNLVVGPNGSGKSTIFQALGAGIAPSNLDFQRIVTNGMSSLNVTVRCEWDENDLELRLKCSWHSKGTNKEVFHEGKLDPHSESIVNELLVGFRLFRLDPTKVAEVVPLSPDARLDSYGANLAAALTNLRDRNEDAFSALRDELRRWLPEFDGIVFETPSQGHRAFKLRLTNSKATVPAKELSEGTLIALALLTLAYDDDPPTLIGIEEPDRGLHPRLLREVRDALYRLAYPKDYGLSRKPVQIIATTHSPVFLDLFRDHPEEIIIASKNPDGTAEFKRLADEPHLQELLRESSLGEVWYSGVLGGVPVAK